MEMNTKNTIRTANTNKSPIKRALLSVSDKTGIANLARILADANIEIVSTGGTAQLLQKNGITVTQVSDYTGFPEMMGGRIKTLHPKIHGGILARRDIDAAVMLQHDIGSIDLVICNLYPFRQSIAKNDCSVSNAIENIDIGGPCMIRAAAKNHRFVTVVVDSGDYDLVAQVIENSVAISDNLRRMLAVKAFAHTAAYDGAIANYFSCLNADDSRRKFPDILTTQYVRASDLRYGENPHQDATFYADAEDAAGFMANCAVLQGKALSFNNINDADAAYACVRDFVDNAAVVVKHANPCGVALGDTQVDNYQRARAADATAAFGGIAAFNRPLQADTAALIVETFMEVVIAPEFETAALAVLAKKKNLRVLRAPDANAISDGWDYKRVQGGLLLQARDTHILKRDDARIVTNRQPTEQEWQDLLFAWSVGKHVKSNAIIFAKNLCTTGIGAGQMSRIDATWIAVYKGGAAIAGSVVASDAFFPFRDGIDALAKAGAHCVIQPGGSIRDEEVIKAANEHNLAMIFTSVRHFRH